MNQILPRIDICIATYQRPQLLDKLLASLINLETAGKFSYAIIVSDNDIHRSSEPIIRKYSAKGLKIIYDMEPEPNISLNRNRALSHATGDYIAILDDDQYVESRWLISLYNTLVSFNADVVFGAVEPVFANNTSRLVRNSGAYGVSNFPEGFSKAMIFHTGNCCFRTELVANTKAYFDVKLGNLISEDAKFFGVLEKRGCKMVWSHQAICYEYVLPERAKMSWLLKRYYKIGLLMFQTFEEEKACEVISLQKNMKAIHLMIKLAKECVSFPPLLVLGIARPQFVSHSVTALKHAAMHLGILSYLLNPKSPKRCSCNG